ncbi:hypothetical protein J7E97_30860 [Streptomyces sp. ISL-66]|uniref:hypothetical protein n=1 Tax=Streptomyces sp. ISL-66 TaxID=2819186 RepID=UPI001BE9482A|nr:hypothetical protein [Streptomyces sp. ISL-66]MBT2472142.1 hypothetical protein [Streptomyces sp. ISL-66]
MLRDLVVDAGQLRGVLDAQADLLPLLDGVLVVALGGIVLQAAAAVPYLTGQADDRSRPRPPFDERPDVRQLLLVSAVKEAQSDVDVLRILRIDMVLTVLLRAAQRVHQRAGQP